MTPKTIAVHGATGSQGAPVAALLDSQGHAVRPVSRSAGAELLDRGSLEAAYAGADVVVLQLPLIYDDRAMRMADHAARAAEAARVGHLHRAVVVDQGQLEHDHVGAGVCRFERAAVEQVGARGAGDGADGVAL